MNCIFLKYNRPTKVFVRQILSLSAKICSFSAKLFGRMSLDENFQDFDENFQILWSVFQFSMMCQNL